MIQEILNFLFALAKKLSNLISQFLTRSQTLHFEHGPTVTIHQKIAEGGFSYIYTATDSLGRSYALKRMMCNDDEMMEACRKEVDVHRNIRGDHVLHLFNVKYTPAGGNSMMCYMLFPLITGGSLRDEVNKRKLLSDDLGIIRPMKERQVLTLFKGVLKGVKSLHDAGYAHCDVKLENVLLDLPSSKSNSFGDDEMGFSMSQLRDPGKPILMDFGSARQLVIELKDRRTVLRVTEEASQNSTISYRAPELFDGGCRHGSLEADIDGKIDVWSCGCLLYGLMYGASPFEMEFRKDGSVRIVDCTHLRILGGKIPKPPAKRVSVYQYSPLIHDLVEWMCTVDRTERPSLDDVMDRVESMLTQRSSGVGSFV